MDSLNRLIDHLGENRVNLTIVPNEFEQAATLSCPSILEKLYESCDSGNVYKTYEKMVECLIHQKGNNVTITKKQRSQILECWRDSQLCDLNDVLLGHIAGVYACNVIVAVFEPSNSFDKIVKGIHNSKPETKTCFLHATPDLSCVSVQIAPYEVVKNDMVANVWMDQSFVSKCLSANEVKCLAKAMGLDTSTKGLLKKELVSMICESLEKRHQKN
jgi:hypothetical protein